MSTPHPIVEEAVLLLSKTARGELTLRPAAAVALKARLEELSTAGQLPHAALSLFQACAVFGQSAETAPAGRQILEVAMSFTEVLRQIGQAKEQRRLAQARFGQAFRLADPGKISAPATRIDSLGWEVSRTLPQS